MSINFRNLIFAIRKVIRENVIATFEKHQYTLKKSCVRYIFQFLQSSQVIGINLRLRLYKMEPMPLQMAAEI